MRAVTELETGRDEADENRDGQHPDVVVLGIVDLAHDENDVHRQCKQSEEAEGDTFQVHGRLVPPYTRHPEHSGSSMTSSCGSL